jgi:Baseplate J-like protein
VTTMDQYACADTGRRLAAVRDGGVLNGIDMLEVDAGSAPGTPAQRTLLVRCLLPLPADLDRADVRVAGGVRADPAINPVRVVWAFPAGRLAAARAAEPALVSQADVDAFAGLPDPARLLVVRTSSAGDFSTYRLLITDPAGRGFDPRLAEVAFTFKVDCPSELDCRVVQACPPERVAEPPIDYLSRDYHGLRGTLLDRLSLLLPQWTDRNAADLGVTVVELFAYLGDHLAYAQDAVAAEAYLGTARRRVSVRRHARLLDYLMHEGAAARTWLVFGAEAAGDGTELAAGTEVTDAGGALVFHTLHPVTVHIARGAVQFHTWGDLRCCLPRGATSATLRASAAQLGVSAGDVLVFEEVLDATGSPDDPDRTHRWAVRLRADPVQATDPLTGDTVVEIRWHDRDALPFPLCLWQFPQPDGRLAGAAVARGNVALAEHGALVGPERLVPPRVPDGGRYRPTLDRQGLAHAVPYDHERASQLPAADALAVAPEAALPGIVSLSDGRQEWRARRDLLASDRFAAEYVVEVEEDGRAQLRFGDGVRGRAPVPGTVFTASYRVGGGRAGNTGRDSLVRLAVPVTGVSVRNPMPAQGGVDPEPVEQVRQWAPQAFRVQQRAVSDADYAEVTQRHPEVQRAAGTRRWTGSWYTEFVTVDRRHGGEVDSGFRAEIAGLLERFRMAGGDVEVDSPVFVPLDIVLTVCVAPGYFRANVKRAVAEMFVAGDLPDGRRGFFHPDNFTFAQPVYLSRVIAAAMSVDGVSWVEATRFQRWGRAPAGESAAGRIPMGRLEVARCDSDPNEPENGRVELVMRGGL